MRRLSILSMVLLPALILAEVGHFRMGDHLMSRGEYDSALEEYREALSDDPDDPEALWRVGAALTNMAIGEISNSRYEKLEEATNYINRAIVGDPGIIESHLEYARALGYLALFRPDWDDVRVARRVKEELGIVLKREPKNPDAWFLMGLWHRWVGPMPLLKRKPNGLGCASIDSSLGCFQKAINIDEDNLLYKLELAKAYLLTGREITGKNMLSELANLRNPPLKFSVIPAAAADKLELLEEEETD